MRQGKRWSGDSELYYESVSNKILEDLRLHVRELEASDPSYWDRHTNVSPPNLMSISIDRPKGVKSVAKPVICLDTGVVYPSATAAAKAVGSTQALISMVCNGIRKRTKGLQFSFKSAQD